MKSRTKALACGILALSGSVFAAGNNETSAKSTSSTTAGTGPSSAIPVHVGDDVVNQVQDIRRNVSDLIAELKEAVDHYGYTNPRAAKSALDKMDQRLKSIEDHLDSKESMADDKAWYEFYNNDQYRITVHESVRDLGGILSSIAKDMESGSKTTVKLPFRVANEIVDKVEDVRDSVSDLVQSIEKSGKSLAWYNWDQDQKKLAEYKQRLNQMEGRLDRKEAVADHDWVAWFGADVYKVTVHDSIAELGSIVSNIGNSLAGQPMKKSSH